MDFRQDNFLLIDETINMVQEFYDGVCEYNLDYLENIHKGKMCFFDYTHLANQFADNPFAQSFIYYPNNIVAFDKRNGTMNFLKSSLKDIEFFKNNLKETQKIFLKHEMNFLVELIQHYILIANPIKMIPLLDERMSNYLFKFYDSNLSYIQNREELGISFPSEICFLFYDSEKKFIINYLTTNITKAKNKRNIIVSADVNKRKNDEIFKNSIISKTYLSNADNLIFDIVTAINKFVSEHLMNEIFNLP